MSVKSDIAKCYFTSFNNNFRIFSQCFRMGASCGPDGIQLSYERKTNNKI